MREDHEHIWRGLVMVCGDHMHPICEVCRHANLGVVGYPVSPPETRGWSSRNIIKDVVVERCGGVMQIEGGNWEVSGLKVRDVGLLIDASGGHTYIHDGYGEKVRQVSEVSGDAQVVIENMPLKGPNG